MIGIVIKNLKKIIMLKKIQNLKGVTVLSKDQKKEVLGGKLPKICGTCKAQMWDWYCDIMYAC